MSINIRLPNITEQTQQGKLQQMQSYMYQLVEQLNWALQTIESGGMAVVTPQGKSIYADDNGDTAGKIDPLSIFNDLKGLIIKSADIVNAYYEEINRRLNGLYVAQSEYGDFVQKTTAKITETSKNTTTNYENIQIVFGKVDQTNEDIIAARKDLTDAFEGDLAEAEKRLGDMIGAVTAILVDVKAYIKSGELYYDDKGIPVYGIEIGQTNIVTSDGVEEEIFNKYARFTSDRLSFYDANDTEVAYISDYKLVITNAWVKETLKLGCYPLGNSMVGRYSLDASNGLALVWVEDKDKEMEE